MSERYQVVVVGCGAIGAATAYWLSRRLGGGVLVLEQYELGHTRGASEDHSRVIRNTYTRSEYTSLAPAAFQSWAVVEQATGLGLVHRTGGLIVARAGGAQARYLDESATALAASGIPFEELTAAEVASRWPQWRLGDTHRAIYDPGAGILDIRRATAAHASLAKANGAEIRAHARVEAIEEIGSDVRVRVGDRTYTADRLVLCGGAWNPVLLQMIGADVPITLTQEQVTYVSTTAIRDFTPDRFPVYAFIEDDGDLYYGLPMYGEVATKIGIDGGGPVVTPESRDDTPDPVRVKQVLDFLDRYLPEASGPELYTRVCCYDLPPDRDFIVDAVPGHERVLISVGAGHAGKFAALLGRVLSELALDDASRFPIDGFRADRFGAGATAEPVSPRPARTNSM